MVDPKRHIYNLSEDNLKFIELCENEFKNRYTDEDSEFMEFFNKPEHAPPLVESWMNRGGDGGGGYHNNRHNNYRRDYTNDFRDNRRYNNNFNNYRYPEGRGGGGGGGHYNRPRFNNHNERQWNYNRNSKPYDRK